MTARGRNGLGTLRRRRLAVAIENLESRLLLSSGGDPSLALLNQSVAHRLTTFVLTDTSTSITPPFTPSQVRQAYGLNNIDFGAVTGNGAGQTIALVDAYNDPNIVTDANTFSSNYGLPQFTVAGDGAPSL